MIVSLISICVVVDLYMMCILLVRVLLLVSILSLFVDCYVLSVWETKRISAHHVMDGYGNLMARRRLSTCSGSMRWICGHAMCPTISLSILLLRLHKGLSI